MIKQEKRPMLLYSGGMDSFILWSILPKNVDAIYFDIGGRYSEQEKSLIRKLNKASARQIKIVKLDFFGKNFEEDDGYIPYRNLIFILKATMLGYNQIYFGMVAEWQRDKSTKFFNLCKFLAKDMGKRDIEILTPFKGVSKSNILKDYLQYHSPMRLSLYSRSCVSGTKKECGICKSCLSKYIALVNNNIYKKGMFEVEPRVDDFLRNRKEKFFSDFRWERTPSTIIRLLEAYEARRKEKIIRS